MDDRPAASLALRARGLGRSFGNVEALSGLDIDVMHGQVHAIVGENGAGKSTLMRLLSGQDDPSAGEISGPAADAGLRRAVALVHQELSLADNLDVAGAIFLGREPARLGIMDLKRMRTDAARWLAHVGLDVDPGVRCGSLRLAQRQLVEIARALAAQAQVLVLDEPTSSLSRAETQRLLSILRELRVQGVAVVYVSHRLDEVLDIADRITVLRDGRLVGSMPRSDASRTGLERMMVGRDIAAPGSGPRPSGTLRLSLAEVRTRHRAGHAVSLHVARGEIVALAGLVGSGRTEVLEAVAGFGMRGGRIELDGAVLEGAPSLRMKRGLALIPEDRAKHGLFIGDPVSRNVSVTWLGKAGHGVIVDRRGELGVVARTLAAMDVRPAEPDRPVAMLSGGNQQKAILGRWIAVSPAAYLLDEPTRGVDIGAREGIHGRIRDEARRGAAVLIASSELEEVLALAHRIIVMHEGRIAGELDAAAATEEDIMALATGGCVERAA